MTDDDNDTELEALIARSLVDRGELIPTSVEEVLDTPADEVELPASLDRLYRPRSIGRIRPLRALSYVGAFAAGVAAVWAVLVATRRSEPIASDATVTPSAAHAASASTDPSADHVRVAMPTCAEDCCAGSACSAAKGDLATCPTERTCIPCAGLDDADTHYRVRVGDLLPANPKALDLLDLDLCIKVGDPTGAWSCEPARAPTAMRPRGRFMKSASRASDLASGVAMELRVNGRDVRGKWWSIVKAGPRSLCRGYRVTFENDQKEPIGTLSMFLERTHYVELAQRDSRAALDDVARAFFFDGLTPQFITSGSRHILAVGPFDRPDAERLLEQIEADAPASLASDARIDHGDAYDGW